MSALTERLTPSRVRAGWRAVSFEAAARARSFALSLTRRKAIYDLSRLDDRMLMDMGLTRGDLQEASRWSLWGDPTDRLSAAADERRQARDMLEV